MHGSLSEGSGTMGNHIHQATLHGYDGIWWTDHSNRIKSSWYQNYIPLDVDLQGVINTEETLEAPYFVPHVPANWASLDFRDPHPPLGRRFLEGNLTAPSQSDWRQLRLSFEAPNKFQTKSLLAEPHVRFDFRQASRAGSAGLLLRIGLSSEPDGLTAEGIPRTMEVQLGPGEVPPPAVGVVRLHLADAPDGVWHPVDLDLGSMAASEWSEAPDLSFRHLDLIAFAKDGGSLGFDLDEFRIEVEGPMDVALLQAQQNLLQQRYGGGPVRNYPGLEVGGPYEQAILLHSSRDHLLALFPEVVDEIPEFEAGSPYAIDYPQAGIDWIQESGGVAILAHVFGAAGEEAPLGVPEAGYLANRVVTNRAWGADGIEVGYPARGQALGDHVAVWDRLSQEGNYLTGVGTSDNHSVLPWDLKVNRWGSWLQADSRDANDLLYAIRAGHVFFGDPHRFQPDGDLSFAAADASYRMGNVVPIISGTQVLRIQVQGATSGDSLILIRNGSEVHRWTFATSQIVATPSLAVAPGDWLRVEVRDASDQIYVMSNPIYYVDQGELPPAGRTPGS